MPGGYRVLSAVIAGPAVESDFAVKLPPNRTVYGSLKIAWPESRFRVRLA